MEQDINLTQLALLVLVALVGGIAFSKIKQPPILAYILCGMILGPSGFAWIQTREPVAFLSELGIIFLMFVVGFELHLDYFKDIWKLAIGCTAGQIFFGLLIAFFLSLFFRWPLPLVLLYGFIAALSSTSVVVKILDTIGQTHTDNGQRAIAVLIAQDLTIVPMILTLQSVQKGCLSFLLLFKIAVSIGLIVGLMVILSTQKAISLPFSRLVFRDKELVTLTSFAFCVAAAWITGMLGLSTAFGGFLAGLFLGNTEQHKTLLDTIRPTQSLLLMIFFFSTGLLLDMSYVIQHFWMFFFLLLAVTIGKSIINIIILHFLKLAWSDAIYVGLLLAQLGEFSFVLAQVAKNLHILKGDQEKLIIGITVLSLSFSPIWLRMAKRMKLLANVNIMSLRASLDFLFGTSWRQRLSMLRGNFGKSSRSSGKVEPQTKGLFFGRNNKKK